MYAAWAVAAETVFMRAYAAGADAFFNAVKVLDLVNAAFLPLQLFFVSSFLAFVIANPRIPTSRGGTQCERRGQQALTWINRGSIESPTRG